MNLPDGFVVGDGLIFWGSTLSKETIVGRGYAVEVPNMNIASTASLNEWHIQLETILSQVGEDTAVQIQWSVNSDYRSDLDRYASVTHQREISEWDHTAREFRYYRGRMALEQSQLRRERLRIYLTRKASSLPKAGLSTEQGFEQFVRQMIRSFDDKMDTLCRQLDGASSQPLSSGELMGEIYRFLNPSMAMKLPEDQVDGHILDLNQSILANCLHSDGITTRDADGNIIFKMDGHYHTLLVFTRWPAMTTPRLMSRLTNTAGLNYCISQNLLPLSIQAELKSEEKTLLRLQREVGRKPAHEGPIAKKRQKINQLMSGFTLPFRVLTVVRIWDESMTGLTEKVSSIKAAISSMNGAQYHQVNHPAQAINLFSETLPGRTGGKIRQWDLYGENRFLPDLLPASSTYVGSIRDAEIILDGDSGNLVGVSTFNGDTPQHAVVVGMTGAGKSVLLTELLSQTGPYYDFTVILEEGLSYGLWTKLQGGEPIIITPDGTLTFNYFDTLGMPLSSTQLAAASALCLKMIGENANTDVNNHRLAIVTAYISQLYADAAEDWSNNHEHEMDGIRRLALAIENHRRTMEASSTFTDGFVALSEIEQQDPDAYHTILEAVGDDLYVLSSTQQGPNAHLVTQLIFSRFTSEMFPTHSALVEVMKSAPLPHHHAPDVQFLATMLEPWQAGEGGKYGCLFDGPNNVDLNGRVVHFELGYIPNSAKQLKEAAAFLVTNHIRQHIVTLPRGQRKRVIFEELVRFKDVPGGAEIIAEFYAQLRKYGCWCCSVIQQYQQLMGTDLCKTIFDNSRIFFLMRQNTKDEIQNLARAISLPDTAQTAISRFELPDGSKGGVRPIPVMLVTTSGGRMECGIILNTPSPEMLYVADSGGRHFDTRRRALSSYSSVYNGVMIEVQKQASERKS